MKKIILILALLSLGVSKAQVVGGYLPLNSSKSATIGAIRTNSLVVTASTISVGAKTLTAGNTGTVAVLSDAVFPIQFGVNSASPGGGAVFTITPNSAGLSTWNNKAMIPYNSTVDYFTYAINVIGTLGSSESGTLSLITNTTLTTCTTAVKFNSVNVVGSGTLSVSITSLDQIGFKIEMPGMVTPPTSIQISVIAWCRRRQ